MISVLVTAFNAERHIGAALESLLEQTAGDFEVIVVDDGSEDRTLAEMRRFEDPRIRWVILGHVGRGKALNRTIAESRGDWLAIQDADDVSHPERLAVQKEVVARNPEIHVLGSEALLFRDGDALDWPAAGAEGGLPAVRDVTRSLAYYNPLPHSSLFIRREALAGAGGYSEARKNLFDLDLYLRLVSGGHRLFRVARPLVAKRIHRHQAFETRGRLSYVSESLRLEWRTMRTLGLGPFHYLALPFLAFYRLMPQELRLKVRSSAAGRRAVASLS